MVPALLRQGRDARLTPECDFEKIGNYKEGLIMMIHFLGLFVSVSSPCN